MKGFKGMELNEFENLIKIIEKADNTKLFSNLSSFKNTLNLQSEDGETELYLKKSLNSLIISRVKLKNRRQGTMTAILKELVEVTKSYKYNTLLVESVLTKEMSEFCLKNGFKQKQNYFGEFDGYLGDYELIIE